MFVIIHFIFSDSINHLSNSLLELKSICGNDNDEQLSIILREIENEVMKISIQLQKSNRSSDFPKSPPVSNRPFLNKHNLDLSYNCKPPLSPPGYNPHLFIDDMLSSQPDDFVIHPSLFRPGKYIRQGFMSPENAHSPLDTTIPAGRVFEQNYPLGAGWAARVAKPRREDVHTRTLQDFQGDLNLVLASGSRAPLYPSGDLAKTIAAEAFITTPRLQNPQQLIPYGAVIKPSNIPIVLSSSTHASTLTPALRTRAHDFHSQTPLSNPGRLAYGDTPHSEAKKPFGRATPNDPANPMQAVAHALHAAGVTTSDPDPIPSTLPPGVAAHTYGTVHMLESEYQSRYKSFLFDPHNINNKVGDNTPSPHSQSPIRTPNNRVPHMDRFDVSKLRDKTAWNGQGPAPANARRVAAASKGLLGPGTGSNHLETADHWVHDHGSALQQGRMSTMGDTHAVLHENIDHKFQSTSHGASRSNSPMDIKSSLRSDLSRQSNANIPINHLDSNNTHNHHSEAYDGNQSRTTSNIHSSSIRGGVTTARSYKGVEEEGVSMAIPTESSSFRSNLTPFAVGPTERITQQVKLDLGSLGNNSGRGFHENPRTPNHFQHYLQRNYLSNKEMLSKDYLNGDTPQSAKISSTVLEAFRRAEGSKTLATASMMSPAGVTFPHSPYSLRSAPHFASSSILATHSPISHHNTKGATTAPRSLIPPGSGVSAIGKNSTQTSALGPSTPRRASVDKDRWLLTPPSGLLTSNRRTESPKKGQKPDFLNNGSKTRTAVAVSTRRGSGVSATLESGRLAFGALIDEEPEVLKAVLGSLDEY